MSVQKTMTFSTKINEDKGTGDRYLGLLFAVFLGVLWAVLIFIFSLTANDCFL